MNIAVILPIYKPNKKWLQECIAALLYQQGVNIYLFAGIDGNWLTKEIQDILKQVKVSIITYKHSGITSTLNKLIVEVIKDKRHFDYIARLDADDIYSKNKLITQIEYMKKHKLDITGTYAREIDSNSNITNKRLSYGSECNGTNVNTENIEEILQDIGNCIIHSSVVFKSDILYSGNYFYTNHMKKSQDYELWLRLLLSDYTFGVVPIILLDYRKSDTQITAGANKGSRNITTRVKEFYKLLRELM